MNLLSPRRPFGAGSSRAYYAPHSESGRPSRCDSDSASDTSSTPTTPTDIATNFHGYNPLDSQTVIYIDLVPENFSGSRFTSFDQASASDEWSRKDVVRTTQHPRPLRSIDPTVTFLSHSPISARSVCTVHSAGMTVFSETTTLTSVGPAPDSLDGALLYSTTLVPGFWDKISDSPGELDS
jgi:transcriptional enhancer factor